MKILVAADMEGVAGVVCWEHVSPDHAEYPRFRKLMTAEVNAAVGAAFDAGATEVLVADGHSHNRNLLFEELDPRAVLTSGSPSPYSMVDGVDQGVDGVLLVGYHARSGAPHAVLDHTWSDVRVAHLWLNDTLVGETGLNAALCGHFGAPILMISGDQAVCDEATALLGDVELAVVKRGVGRMAAECLAPLAAQERIRAATLHAVKRLRAGRAPKPFTLAAPITLKVELNQSEMADKAAWLPGALRQERCITYVAADMPTAYRAFRTILALARP